MPDHSAPRPPIDLFCGEPRPHQRHRWLMPTGGPAQCIGDPTTAEGFPTPMHDTEIRSDALHEAVAWSTQIWTDIATEEQLFDLADRMASWIRTGKGKQ